MTVRQRAQCAGLLRNRKERAWLVFVYPCCCSVLHLSSFERCDQTTFFWLCCVPRPFPDCPTQVDIGDPVLGKAAARLT